jgi:hypothetical protein
VNVSDRVRLDQDRALHGIFPMGRHLACEDHHPPIWFLKVEVGASFMGVGPAVVLLSQPGRQAAISPASLLAATPSWGTIVTPVQAVFVSVPVPWLPILIIAVAGDYLLAGVRLLCCRDLPSGQVRPRSTLPPGRILQKGVSSCALRGVRRNYCARSSASRICSPVELIAAGRIKPLDRGFSCELI